MISDAKQGTIFFSYDIKDLFLALPLDCHEYMKILYKYIPYYIWTCYSLETIVADDVYLYANNKMGAYGLKQADLLAYDILVENIWSSVYSPISDTIGMLKYDTKRTNFVFVWMVLGLNILVINMHNIY